MVGLPSVGDESSFVGSSVAFNQLLSTAPREAPRPVMLCHTGDMGLALQEAGGAEPLAVSSRLISPRGFTSTRGAMEHI